ncbi:GAF domain-containing protein [Mycobacterium sp.]|uniref:GAF domain-containing protein n=1 Tax=Mycobacterium sp. TaxID=1785 RepID=UPI003D13B25F
MIDTPREARILNAVVSLVDSLLDNFDIVELLTDLTERCATLLDVEAAGLLLADPRQRLHLMAATSQGSHEVELFQLQTDEGPCLDCFADGHPVSVPDLAAEQQRWPRFAPAVAQAGFASVHAIPMRAANTVLGALGLFGTHAGKLDDADLLIAQALAHIACVAILQEHAPTQSSVLPQLRTALTSRVVVDQAIGILSERVGVPVEDAFGLLRRYAHVQGQHLTEVSRRLVSEPDAREQILDGIRGTLDSWR